MSSARRAARRQRAVGPVQFKQGPNERAQVCRERMNEVLQRVMGEEFNDDVGTSIAGSCLITAGVDALLWVGFSPQDVIDFLAGHLRERAEREALGDMAPPRSLLLPSGEETGPETPKDKPS